MASCLILCIHKESVGEVSYLNILSDREAESSVVYYM